MVEKVPTPGKEVGKDFQPLEPFSPDPVRPARIDIRIYVCPALMDALVFLVNFAVMFGAGRLGFSTGQCALLTGLAGILYALASLAAGVRLRRENARRLALAGAVLCGGLGVALVWGKTFPLLLGLNLVFSGSAALFFNGFQTFMRGESPPGGLARSVGFYTLAWSSGSGAGFLASGSLFDLGPMALSALVLGMAAAVILILLRHRPRALHEHSADEHVEEGSAAARRVNPGYVLVGWVTIFTICFVQRALMTFFPVINAKEGITPFLTGLPLFLQMALQAAMGVVMLYGRDLLYRRTPMVLVQGFAALLLFSLWRPMSYPALLVVFSALGVYAGYAFFTAVYYAGNSGRRSFNTGVNEFLVGSGGVAGIFLSARAMEQWGDSALYLVCAIAVAVALAVQAALGGTPRGARAQKESYRG